MAITWVKNNKGKAVAYGTAFVVLIVAILAGDKLCCDAGTAVGDFLAALNPPANP